MSLEIDLKGKVALVTGVSQGVGLGVAQVLGRAGCVVAGCSFSTTDSPKAKNFTNLMEEQNIESRYFSTDVTKPEELSHLVESVVEEFGSIDIVISNAGINVFKGTLECSDEDWSYNDQLNLASHWRLGKLAYPHLAGGGKGVFIAMTSNHCHSTIPGCFPYNVSKTAIKGLVQSMAIEWGPEVRAMAVAPGFIQTPGSQKWFDSFEDPREELERTINRHPVGRLGTVEEVGTLCAFLASDYAGFISGTTYLMDGGRSALMQD